MTAAATPAVRCRGLVKTYGRGDAATPALRALDLDVQAGELTLLVGPSGCGKTTLLSIIAGLLAPDAGSCEVLGQSLATRPEVERAAFRRRHLGFVFQNFNLLPSLTAAQNVAVPLLLQGMRERDAIPHARSALATLGLDGRGNAWPSTLSGGQQQRVAIARALVHAPDLVVCDEPTSALDHATGQAVMQQLRDIARDATRALLVVTHDPRIYDYADRIVEMDDGHVIDDRDGPARTSA
ncbi:ABC transporter ATP-binding protein [Lysobacter sp. TY2-98]|uniref:ABC transporter ATP-binding protein n=1 Tax=Lysobacter sp. TY2-98 TaxID=2290922 RepID=UPI000E1FF266|nr:ABC transporter ATP-binding protein [Lysobacter sp. TY2-98]AXK73725.1 ABC transporter ATP-binding protein [Lysobacter sp. TY2-98]